MEIISEENFIQILLILCRLLPIIIFLPGANYVPVNIKLLFAIVFSFLLTFVLENDWGEFNLALYVQEGLIGTVIGLSINILFQSINAAGAMIASQSGLSQATFFNPANFNQESAVAKFLFLLIITLVFVTDSHMVIFSSVLNTYEIIPPRIDTMEYLNLITYSVVKSFELAIKFALPIATICTLVYFASGIIGKLIPYIQIFFIVAPLQICIGMVTLFLTLLGVVLWFLDSCNNFLMGFYQS